MSTKIAIKIMSQFFPIQKWPHSLAQQCSIFEQIVEIVTASAGVDVLTAHFLHPFQDHFALLIIVFAGLFCNHLETNTAGRGSGWHFWIKIGCSEKIDLWRKFASDFVELNSEGIGGNEGKDEKPLVRLGRRKPKSEKKIAEAMISQLIRREKATKW